MSQSNEDKPNLDRRRFVQGTAAFAVGSAGVVLATGNQAETHNPSCKTPGCDYDVVVIGGGFAGAVSSEEPKNLAGAAGEAKIIDGSD